MAEGAELLSNEETDDGHLISLGLKMGDSGRWVRKLFWKPGGYVLVIDRVQTDTDETFTAGVNWRCGGELIGVDGDTATLGFEPGNEGRFFVQVSEGLRLESEVSAYPALGEPQGTPGKTEVLLHGTMDCQGCEGAVEVATLLHAVESTTEPAFRLSRREQSWVVTSSDGDVTVSSGSESLRVATSLADDETGASSSGTSHKPSRLALTDRWKYSLAESPTVWTQSGSRDLVIGTRNGRAIQLDRAGGEVWAFDCWAEVTAMTCFGEDRIVGTKAGQVIRVDADGREKWTYTCAFREERSFWPWWFLNTPTIGALAAGHDSEKGADVVAAGTGSTNLCFLDAQTGELLGDVISPYGLPDLIRPHSTSETLRFLVGHSWLTCGSTVRLWIPFPEPHDSVAFSRSVNSAGRSEDGWDTCGVVDFWTGSMEEGESERLVVLRHGAVNQVSAYDIETGDPLWDATLGVVPVALAVVTGATGKEAGVYVADRFGWLARFDGRGRRTTSLRAASRILGMHVSERGNVVLWDRDDIVVVREDRVIDRYDPGGIPLGWYSDPVQPGLLCMTNSHLVLKDLSDPVD